MSISAELMAHHDITEGETEGFIGYARSIEGVEVAFALREWDDGNIRIGFRSKVKVDVSQVAAEFGGGGHVHASGCTMRGSLEEVKSKVLPRQAPGELGILGRTDCSKQAQRDDLHDVVVQVRRITASGRPGTQKPWTLMQPGSLLLYGQGYVFRDS